MKAIALLLLVAAEPEWKKVDDVDGIAISARELPNERVVELQLVTTSKLSVEKLCDAAFGDGSLDPQEPGIASRKILKQSATERVTYEQIDPPLVSKRDYTVRATRELLADGRCVMAFGAANLLGPAKTDGIVRIEKLRGRWEFERVGGSTRATYVIFTDPGGSIPAAFIEGSRRKTAVAWVKLVLERAAKQSR